MIKFINLFMVSSIIMSASVYSMNLQIVGTYIIGGDGSAAGGDSVQLKIISQFDSSIILDWTTTFTNPSTGQFGYSTFNTDISAGDIISFRINSNCCGMLTTDQTIEARDVNAPPGGALNPSLNFTYTDAPDPVYGCTDDTACNYDSSANTDDGSCEYPDDCMVCFGENTICENESVNFLDNWNGCHDESELATWLEYNWGYNLRPYNDIWGYTDSSGSQYALVGTWDGTHIINIDNSPVEVGFIPGSFSTHRDIKTYGHYMYMGTEANLGDPSLLPEWFVDSEGIQVVDISDPANPLLVNEWQEGIIQSHNIMVDETGYLYVIGADEGDDTDDLHILDLSNPSNPVKVGGWSLDSPMQSGYLHDVCVYEDILYGCGIYDHKMFAIDVSDKTNPQLIAQWPGVPSAHACWVSDDGNTVFTGSETTGGYIMSWDVSDLNNINLIDEWMPDNGQNWSAHNVFVKGNYLYISYYVYGLQILDISDPSNIFSVGFYDTYPEEEGGYVYSGVWGTFPYLDDNKVIMTDRVNGLYVLEHIIDQVYDLGDINQDGEVNVLDVIVMINMIIGSEEQDEIADINDDGDVNVLDIVELVSIVLNGSSNLSDECYLEPDSGPCLAYVPMYYYNTDTQACEMFIWGGCGGTVPFENIEDCINSCE